MHVVFGKGILHDLNCVMLKKKKEKSLPSFELYAVYKTGGVKRPHFGQRQIFADIGV